MASMPSPRGHRLRRVQGEAAGEHRESLQHAALVAGEQVVGPVDRTPQGLVTLDAGATPRVSSRNWSSRRAAISTGVMACSARRRELDRERDAVEARADLRHGIGVVGVQGEAGTRLGRALDEQRDCVVGHAERGQREDPLARERESFATRGQDRHARRRA